MASSAARPKDSKLAGHQEQIGEGKQLADALLLAEEVNAGVDAEIVGQPLGGGAVGAVADEHKLRGALRGPRGQRSSPRRSRA